MSRSWSLLLGIVLLASTVIGTAQESGRGSTVLLRGPDGSLVVSTAVALPGDTVAIVDGAVRVNGQPTAWRVDGARNWGPTVVNEGTYFVAGDPAKLQNKPESWGLVSLTRIVGILRVGVVPK
jgi:type IV secretory pathway protease TraF